MLLSETTWFLCFCLERTREQWSQMISSGVGVAEPGIWVSIGSNQAGEPLKFSSAAGQAPRLPANKNCSLANKPLGWQLAQRGL